MLMYRQMEMAQLILVYKISFIVVFVCDYLQTLGKELKLQTQ